MNVTQSKDRKDRTVYTVTGVDNNPALVEWMFDLPNDVCRVDLENVGYLRFDTVAARQGWADGYRSGLKVSQPASDALMIVYGYVHAEKDDMAYLDEQLADAIAELPAALRSEVQDSVARIKRLFSFLPQPSSSTPPGSP